VDDTLVGLHAGCCLPIGVPGTNNNKRLLFINFTVKNYLFQPNIKKIKENKPTKRKNMK
jgi:hypothetical protein